MENAQRRAIRRDETADVAYLRLLLDRKAIGPMSATLFVREFFGWRKIENRHEPASLGGLDPILHTPAATVSGQAPHHRQLSR